jgi:hypothetical protein
VFVLYCRFQNLIAVEFGGAVQIGRNIKNTSIEDSYFTGCELHMNTAKTEGGLGGGIWSEANDAQVVRSCGFNCTSDLFGKFLDLERSGVIHESVTESTVFRCAFADNLDISVTESMGGAIASTTSAMRVNVANFTACEAYYGSALLILLPEQSSGQLYLSILWELLVVGCKQKTGIDIISGPGSSILSTIC